jgi:hypothetical protein
MIGSIVRSELPHFSLGALTPLMMGSAIQKDEGGLAKKEGEKPGGIGKTGKYKGLQFRRDGKGKAYKS